MNQIDSLLAFIKKLLEHKALVYQFSELEKKQLNFRVAELYYRHHRFNDFYSDLVEMLEDEDLGLLVADIDQFEKQLAKNK